MDFDWQRANESADIAQLKRILQGCTPTQITDQFGVSYMVPAITLGGVDSSTATSMPWDILPAAGNSNIELWPGTVNGILAGNMFGSFAVDGSSLWYVKAACISDGTRITGVTVVVNTQPPSIQVPAQNSMPPSVEVLVGILRGGISYNIARGNVSLRSNIVSSADGNYSGTWV